MATPRELLSALASAYSLAETRVSGDPEYAKAIERVREALRGTGWMVVKVDPEGLTAGGDVFPAFHQEFGPFQSVLEAAGIRELRFQEVMETEVLEEFLRRLHPSFAPEGTLPSARFRGFEEDVGLSFREPQAALPGMAGAVQGLFRNAPSTPRAGAAEASGPGASSSADEPAGPVRALPPELAMEVDTFLRSADSVRTESGRKLRVGAATLAQSRNVAGLSELVCLLAEAGGSDSVDQGAIELARECTTPAAASHIVALLGTARDEKERGRLAKVLSRCGKEGALALADALGESRDRSERRAFLDAMVTLGPLAFEMAQRLTVDPRWFVVRNGVSVLGELGGEEAVSHLTATLANGDSRVRKETVLSLAKVGGSDAEMLILGMLDDGAAPVRSAACRALGALRSHRAYRPLLELLKDEDQEVQAEALQALGQVGDPGAVPFIEKKAKGGLFSRPSREVRIAAFRALASIGTARSLKLLGKAAEDRDPSVRTIARALVREG